MDFLKKHYEKILLGVMLVGLIGVLVFMLFYIASDKNEMTNRSQGFIDNPHIKDLTNLDLSMEEGAINRLKSSYQLDFDNTNKLLNPMEWQRAMDGSLIRATKTGPRIAVVTNITPLYLIVSLDSTITNEMGASYRIRVERQAAATPAKRGSIGFVRTVGEKPEHNDPFMLEKIKGSPENPDALVLKLLDTGDEVTITKDAPYRRVEGYFSDLRYDPERKAFHARRVGDRISFGGVDYTVVEVKQNGVVLMDQSNQKRTSLPFTP